MEKKRKKERKEREEEGRERSSTFSLGFFFKDRTVGSCRSKKKSSFSRQDLQVETKIREFRQIPRGGGFLLLDLIIV